VYSDDYFSNTTEVFSMVLLSLAKDKLELSLYVPAFGWLYII
jgi:hypothetical protein